MITNFENITHELNDQELALVPIIAKSFEKYTKANPIKAPEIVKRFNQSDIAKQYIKLTEPRLRKICNYIRSNAMIPLIATSSGYFVSNDKEEIEKQIKSLVERSNSIRQCADGLTKFLL